MNKQEIFDQFILTLAITSGTVLFVLLSVLAAIKFKLRKMKREIMAEYNLTDEEFEQQPRNLK